MKAVYRSAHVRELAQTMAFAAGVILATMAAQSVLLAAIRAAL